MEEELREHKAETAALWESHTKVAALETETHLMSVKEQHQHFLTQLGQVRDHTYTFTETRQPYGEFNLIHLK